MITKDALCKWKPTVNDFVGNQKSFNFQTKRMSLDFLIKQSSKTFFNISFPFITDKNRLKKSATNIIMIFVYKQTVSFLPG